MAGRRRLGRSIGFEHNMRRQFLDFVEPVLATLQGILWCVIDYPVMFLKELTYGHVARVL